MITKLTPQQEALILSYRQKWKAISLSTERINRKRVLAVLEDVYRLYPEGGIMPEVVFFDSPYAAFSAELKITTANYQNLSDGEVINTVAGLQTLSGEGQVRTDLGIDLYINISNSQYSQEIWEVLNRNLVDEVGREIHEQVWKALWDWLTDKLIIELKDSEDAFSRFYSNFIDPDSEWPIYTGLCDFCINELNCQHDEEQWHTYQTVFSECGWWFLPTPRHYIICDRPTKLLIDEQEKLHAEGEPAIQFSDGFGLYAQHGKIDSICFP